MKHVESQLLFVPDQTYYFGVNKELLAPDLPDEVAELLERENAAYEADKSGYFQELADAVREPVTPGGPKYAVIREPGSSEHTAMVFTLPFCNPLKPDFTSGGAAAQTLKAGNKKGFDSNTANNLIKHGFTFDVMKALGVRDSEGKTVPIVIVSADSADYNPKLTRKQKKDRKNGDLSIYADNAEAVLEHEGYGRVHVGGYSQGASVGHAMLARSTNLDVVSATLAEMTSYKDRPTGELAKNYLLDQPAPKNESGIKSEGKWTESGPESRRELESIQNRAMITMAQTIALKGAWRTALALKHGTMQADLIMAVKERGGVFPLTIGWNGTSSITHDIEDRLIRPYPNEALDPFRDARMLRLTKAIGHEAAGAPHLAGESPLYYALLMGQSVAWATQRR